MRSQKTINDIIGACGLTRGVRADARVWRTPLMMQLRQLMMQLTPLMVQLMQCTLLKVWLEKNFSEGQGTKLPFLSRIQCVFLVEGADPFVPE